MNFYNFVGLVDIPLFCELYYQFGALNAIDLADISGLRLLADDPSGISKEDVVVHLTILLLLVTLRKIYSDQNDDNEDEKEKKKKEEEERMKKPKWWDFYKSFSSFKKPF